MIESSVAREPIAKAHWCRTTRVSGCADEAGVWVCWATAGKIKYERRITRRENRPIRTVPPQWSTNQSNRSVEAVICRQGGETTRGKIRQNNVGNNRGDSLYWNQVISR